MDPSPLPPANPLVRFLTEMDSKTARTLWVSALLLTVAGAILAFGMVFLNVDQSAIADVLRGLRHAWWAPAAVAIMFIVLAFIGAPQVVLIAATVAVFGPEEGAVLSWGSTMISAIVGFYVGRAAGAEALRRIGGELIQRLTRRVKENALLAALIIRLVPSGPFIIVNMALGATGMRSAPFLIGSGIGFAPKILLIAFAGHGVARLMANQTMLALAILGAAALVWLLIVYVIRPRLRARNAAND